jgi:hypothetical protein
MTRSPDQLCHDAHAIRRERLHEGEALERGRQARVPIFLVADADRVGTHCWLASTLKLTTISPRCRPKPLPLGSEDIDQKPTFSDARLPEARRKKRRQPQGCRH